MQLQVQKEKEKKKGISVFRIAAASFGVNMAPGLGLLLRLSSFRNTRCSPLWSRRTVTPCRTAVSTSSGAILPKPKKVSAD